MRRKVENLEMEDEYDGLINDPVNNPFFHSEHHPFCTDETCYCREDQNLIQELNGHVQNGLATPQDADRIYHGRNI